jgi:hypothetical protein
MIAAAAAAEEAAAAAARNMQQQKSPPSSSNCALSNPPIRLAAASRGTETLIKLCRLRKDIPDERTFIFAVAYALNQHTDDVIAYVTDPVLGLPDSLRFPLEIVDVQKACEPRLAVLAMEKGMARERAAPHPTQLRRPWHGLTFSNGFGQHLCWVIRCEGPALEAGIKTNDRVTREDRQRIALRLQKAKPGDRIQVPMMRGDQPLTFEVVLSVA